MIIPKSGEFYRHFKNKLYQIVTVAEHSEDGQKLVIYQALYGEFKVYARPLEMFMSEIDHEKYPDVEQKYRFVRVESGEIKETKRENIEAASNFEKIKQEAEMGKENKLIVEEMLPEESETEELPDAGLLEFLDEEDWDKKYNILVSLRTRMTEKLVDALAVALDVVIPEGPIDKRYEQLKICVRTRQKYENQHLR